jgi:hypothetical protein
LKKYSTVFILFLCVSCQFIDKQIPSEEELLKKEIQTIDWKKVDEFPTIITCDSVFDKTLNQECFIKTLSALIQQKLDTDKPKIQYTKLDTITVLVSVLPNATLQFETKQKDDNEKIDSILKAKLVDFPIIKPAIKRGIPVKTQFTLPVILKVE